MDEPATVRPSDRPSDLEATQKPLDPVAAAVRQLLQEAAATDTGGRLGNWYAARHFAPAWDAPMAAALIGFTRGLRDHGLEPFLFDLAGLENAWGSPAAADATSAARLAAERDLQTTRHAVRVVETLASGFVDPGELHPKWSPLPPRVENPFDLIDRALLLAPEELALIFGKAEPRDLRYRKLVAALARYRDISDRGGWRVLSDPGRVLKPGDTYADVGLLRGRLRAEGDLPASASRTVPSTINAETATAIEAFQFRHGITPDGIIGPQTLSELNIPVTHRINALIVNLERLRWMPDPDASPERVEVNIAESALRLFRGAERVGTMRVIVGVHGKHQTPLFHDHMEYLIFRPYWNVPISIARDEIGPIAADDPDYLSRNNYEIVPRFGVSASEALPIHGGTVAAMREGRLSLRQGTGPKNALGLVKFIFPNDSAVYLHDTPNHSLFDRTDRDFSHGCVRVSEPARLAEFSLAANGDWSFDRIQEALEDSQRPNRQVNLVRSIPVYLCYWTATILDDGRMRFDQDIYGHDAPLRGHLGLGARTRPVELPAAEPAAE